MAYEPEERQYLTRPRNQQEALPPKVEPPLDDLKGQWVPVDTAIVVVHGIGQQKPLETLDRFCRGLATAYKEHAGATVNVVHRAKEVEAPAWSDIGANNYLEMRQEGSKRRLDVYEYYWAHHTQGKVSLADISAWAFRMGRGAKKFYSRMEMLEERYVRERSFFFNKKGKFRKRRYRLVLYVLTYIVPLFMAFMGMLVKLAHHVPVVGLATGSIAEWMRKKVYTHVRDVIGDIVVYNTYDQKSRFYPIRNDILEGIAEKLRGLLEPASGYDRVIVVGHSLGSQVAFDAINRLTHLIRDGKIMGYGPGGHLEDERPGCDGNSLLHISDILCGLVTFGSPLDKIAFFLGDLVDEKECLRLQMLDDFLVFKQRDWLKTPRHELEFPIRPIFARMFDNILWKNYHDRRDYVSGALDYYYRLVNVDCQFQFRRVLKVPWALQFTHDWYWDHAPMYVDIIRSILNPKTPPTFVVPEEERESIIETWEAMRTLPASE